LVWPFYSLSQSAFEFFPKLDGLRMLVAPRIDIFLDLLVGASIVHSGVGCAVPPRFNAAAEPQRQISDLAERPAGLIGWGDLALQHSRGRHAVRFSLGVTRREELVIVREFPMLACVPGGDATLDR